MAKAGFKTRSVMLRLQKAQKLKIPLFVLVYLYKVSKRDIQV